MTDTDPTLAALIPDPHSARTHDARNLALIADALRDVIVRRREDLTGKPAEPIPGTATVDVTLTGAP